MMNPYRLLAVALGTAAWLAAPLRGSAAETAVFYLESAKVGTEPIDEFAGLPGKVLSRNTETGRLALELLLPAGFRDRADRRPDDRSFEIVVLDGQVRFGKEWLGPRDFGYAPAGVDLKLEIQHLKKDPFSGARTWLVRLAPPVTMPFEVHSVAEEAYVLAGRYSQPECLPDGLRTGIYEANSYFYRPGGIPHSGPGAGPIEPTTFLMRSPGTLDVTFYSACTNAVASQRVSSDATTRREVSELLQRWVQLRNDGRWDELATLLADDPRFAWIEFGRVTMGSHAAALTELAKARGRPVQTSTELSEAVVEPLTSELALLRANFRISAASSATAQGIERVGVLTATLIFRAGRWQFLQVNFSQTR